jgi:N-hydroxyarylamine O-acetyltransferase
LSSATAEKLLQRFGFSAPPAPTFAGLEELYLAWCRHVPFDNIRKRIALAGGKPGPLPGGTAEDFFGAWLAHGTGGTCWPTSNGLYALLAWCGFEARRISASMHEEGTPNHGSVIVRLGGEDYLVDSSMLTDRVIPLRPGEPFELADAIHPIVAEPVADAWRIWFGYTMSESTMACRLLEDPVDHPFYLARYEISREMSPFNVALYARRNLEGRLVSFLGRTRFSKSAGGIEANELGDEELERALREDLELSGEMVAKLKEVGC